MEQKKAVGIWVRVSTDLQGDSPEHHEKRAKLYAEAKGWDIKRVYRLEAVSGKSVMGLAETKKMLNDISEGHITGLIFSKLARLARNKKELLEFADIFKEQQADLISLEEAIDTSSPAGRLFYTMIAAMAQWEREEIAARISASLPIRAKLGKLLSGKLSYGYVWDGEKIAIDEKEAPVRRLVYELFLKYKRKKAVARELNRLGYRTRSGVEFTGPTIHRLLIDPTAKGEHRANFTTRVGTRMVKKPQSEWIIQPCPAIVTEDVWNECNRIIEAQIAKTKRPGPRPKHLLVGFVFCEPCDKKMYVFHESSDNYVCKLCKTRIPASDLDEIFHEQLRSFLLTDTDISEYLNQSHALIKEKEELLQVTTAEMEELRKKLNDLVSMRLQGEMTKERFAEFYQPIEERLGQLENQLPELQAEIDFIRIQSASSDVVLQDAKDLYSRWLDLSFEEKRTIIEIITDKIVIGREDIHLSLSYLPTRPPIHNDLVVNGGNSERNGTARLWF